MGKTTIKKNFQYLKNYTLGDFKKSQYKNQTNPELARIAADLFGLEPLPNKQLIDRWRAAESELQEQAKGLVTISNHEFLMCV